MVKINVSLEGGEGNMYKHMIINEKKSSTFKCLICLKKKIMQDFSNENQWQQNYKKNISTICMYY